jgi:hypothetical protein
MLSPSLLTSQFVVVGPAACRIAQHFIGLPDGQKWFAVLSRAIGVILLGLPTISRSDLILGGIGTDPENQVVVSCHLRPFHLIL